MNNYSPGGRLIPPSEGRDTEKNPSKISPAGGVVPVLYGGPKKIPGLFVYISEIDNVLNLIYLLSEGELEEVGTVYINNADSADYGLIPGGGIPVVNVEKYTGTQGQTVCSLANYDANWTFPLTGIAYIYVRIADTSTQPPERQITGMPTVEAACKGRKVYNPATETVIFSSNPALCIADALTDVSNGGRIASTLIDWASFAAAAAYCDEVLGTTPNTEKRFEFSYLFTGGTLQSAIDIMRLHCLADIIFEDGKYKITIAKPRTVADGFIEDKDEILNIEFLPSGSEEMVNIVNWDYYSSVLGENIAESIEDPNLGANDEIHEASYDLTGFNRLSQSKRVATYKLNSSLLRQKVRLGVYNSKGLQKGDVFAVTHSLGLSAEEFSVTAITELDNGAWIIEGQTYDSSFFTDEVIPEPTY